MTEDAAVFGGQKNMFEGLENSLKLYQPEMMAVSTTCMAEVIGDDLNAFITNAKKDLTEDQGKGFLYSYLIVPEDTRRTGELRAWLSALHGEEDMHVYVSHDVADMRELNQRY